MSPESIGGFEEIVWALQQVGEEVPKDETRGKGEMARLKIWGCPEWC
jgi:hypothetical protein